MQPSRRYFRGNQVPFSLKHRRGFTLIEVLVSLVVLSLLAIGGSLATQGLVDQMKATEQRELKTVEVQRAIEQLDFDLNAVKRSGRQYSTRFTESSVVMVRGALTTPRSGSGAVVVAWFMRDHVLFRWQSEPIHDSDALFTYWGLAEALVLNQVTEPPIGQTNAMLRSVRIIFQAFRDGAWTNPLSSGGSGTKQGKVTSGVADSVKAVELVIQVDPAVKGRSLTYRYVWASRLDL